MEVTRHNFAEALPLVKQALDECQFFAIDCEFTGLFLEDRSTSFLDDMEDRYAEMLASSRAFVINQFGLSAYVWEEGAYRPRTFNFYTFPRPFEGADKRFVCQASSLDFLASCGFDFNKAIYDGVSYMTAAQRDAKLAAVERPPRERGEVLVKKEEDVAFVAATVAAVAQWLQGEEPQLLLPAVNAYQRLLQYQELRRPQYGVAQPPGFYVERVAAEEGSGFQLRLTRADAEEVAAWEAAQREQRIEAIHAAAGFATVLEAARDSGKPAVGHNLAFDLAYSLHSFAQELPGSWEQYKQLVGRWFPGGIYDTKHLAGLLPEVFADTSLGSVHDGLIQGQLQQQVTAFLLGDASGSLSDSEGDGGGVVAPQLPKVEHAPGFERYKGVNTSEYAHEAGYDAYMTGAAFACLVRLFEARAAGGEPGAAAALTGRQPSLDAVRELCWRMNISRSDYPYAALQGEDPVPDRSHVFYVTGWAADQRVHGGEIARKLADAGLGQVRASMVEGGAAALVEVGDPEAVPGAADVLRERLPGWTVGPYSEYADKRLQHREKAAAEREAAAAAAAARRNGNKNKRARVDAEAVAQQGGAAPAGAAATGPAGGNDGSSRTRCTIM